MSKTGVLLVNLGTPDSSSRKDVKKYLAEFLMDGRVIDISYWKRFLLVRGIIAPFRSKKVSKEYEKLWLNEGSPLMVYGKQLAGKVQHLFNQNNAKVSVVLAMRYQTPSIQEGLEKLKEEGVERIIVFPLFPQYASATTGSVAQKVMELISQWQVIPSIEFINTYHSNPLYIKAFADKVKADIDKYNPDHILFSYHGIPERHLERIKKQNEKLCSFPSCNCKDNSQDKPYCYRSACFRTTQLITEELQLSPEKYSTSFQSRLGKNPWIQPYTDESIRKLSQSKKKNLLVVSPSFVADCLETTLEIGEEYKELFKENGGEVFHFTKSLNANDSWAEAIYKMVSDSIK